MNSITGKFNATPAFWRVEGPKGSLYILGSLHLLPENCHWLSPAISEPLEESDFFIGEVEDLSELNKYFSEQSDPGGKCLSETHLGDYLDSNQFKQLSGLISGFGVQQDIWGYYKPWFMNIFLSTKIWGTEGYLPEFGVDSVLNSTMKANEKICFGLENPEFQLKIFDDLTLETQINLLKITIGAREYLGSLFQIIYEGWRKADLDAIYKNIIQPLMENKEYYHALFPKRHPSWGRQLNKFLQIPGDFFLAAGVNHFLGPDSVLLLLEKEGHKVTRIQ